MCLVTWHRLFKSWIMLSTADLIKHYPAFEQLGPGLMNIREAGSDLALIQTSLLFSFKCRLVSIRMIDSNNKGSEVCIKTRSPAALARPLNTKKWSIDRTNERIKTEEKRKSVKNSTYNGNGNL